MFIVFSSVKVFIKMIISQFFSLSHFLLTLSRQDYCNYFKIVMLGPRLFTIITKELMKLISIDIYIYIIIN